MSISTIRKERSGFSKKRKKKKKEKKKRTERSESSCHEIENH